jgi:putative protein-disulfide isomerase
MTLQDNAVNRELIYIADPMCSWCWGFSPVISEVATQAKGRVKFSIVTGGLRSETEPMSEERRQTIGGHWKKVYEATGQPFSFELLESATFVYDTEPACRAVVTVRSMLEDHAGLEMFDRLQSAFYAENLDISDALVCAGIAASAGFDETAFSELMASVKMKDATQADFARARQMGVRGFPSIVVREGERAAYLSRGYRPYADLRGALAKWLDEGFGGD